MLGSVGVASSAPDSHGSFVGSGPRGRRPARRSLGGGGFKSSRPNHISHQKHWRFSIDVVGYGWSRSVVIGGEKTCLKDCGFNSPPFGKEKSVGVVSFEAPRDPTCVGVLFVCG